MIYDSFYISQVRYYANFQQTLLFKELAQNIFGSSLLDFISVTDKLNTCTCVSKTRQHMLNYVQKSNP